jgi:hypothetical protein
MKRHVSFRMLMVAMACLVVVSLVASTALAASASGAAAALFSTRTMLQTAAPATGTVLTFTAEADALVAQASPTTNYGTSSTLQSSGDSGRAQTSYIRFTVKGTHDTIQGVKLRVFCTIKGTTNGPAAYLADNNWIESGPNGITWNNQPALWSSELDNKSTIGKGAWVEYDVSSLITGDGTYTFALVADGTNNVIFSSREGSAPPQLVVTFEP